MKTQAVIMAQRTNQAGRGDARDYHHRLLPGRFLGLRAVRPDRRQALDGVGLVPLFKAPAGASARCLSAGITASFAAFSRGGRFTPARFATATSKAHRFYDTGR